MRGFKTDWDDFVMLAIMAVAIVARFYAYGDPRLSIGNTETYGYVISASAPLFSWEVFAGERLFTTNLIYKFASNPKNCPPTEISYPGGGTHDYRKNQPCFDAITVLQNFLSIIGWCLLAWTTSRWLSRGFMKLITTGLILAFAFTPQVAEWDSLLSPESLSVSLFIISFSLLQEIVFRITHDHQPIHSTKNVFLIAGWLCMLILWVFVRDVHLYAVLAMIALLALLFLERSLRRSKVLPVAIVVLIGIFLLGFISARDGLRASVPLKNSYGDFIFPFPSRVDLFKKLGMPDPGSSEFQTWFNSHGTTAYAVFLLTHPGFVITTLWDSQYYFKADFSQPYFNLLNTNLEATLFTIGQSFHPETIAIFLVDALFFAMLCFKAFSQKEPTIMGWTWLAAWFLFCSAITLVISFFGDTTGILRHVFPSVESFRLFFWINLLFLIDMVINPAGHTSQATSLI